MTLTIAIPHELIKRSQWVCWHYVIRDGRPSKVPIFRKSIPFAIDGSPTDQWCRVKTNDPTTWMTHADATSAADRRLVNDVGIGYVITADDPYVGVDLDNCRNPVTGVIEPWALEIITRFGFSSSSPLDASRLDPAVPGNRRWLDARGRIWRLGDSRRSSANASRSSGASSKPPFSSAACATISSRVWSYPSTSRCLCVSQAWRRASFRLRPSRMVRST